MHLFLTVVYQGRAIVFVPATDDHRVSAVKQLIARACGIDAKCQHLSFNGVQLEDGERLGAYRLPPNAGLTLTLPVTHSVRFHVFVETPCSPKALKLRVGFGTTVRLVREALAVALRIPADQQVLAYGPWLLDGRHDDWKTLGDLGIRADDTMRMFFSNGDAPTTSASSSCCSGYGYGEDTSLSEARPEEMSCGEYRIGRPF